ncbi:MAG TPA: VWA domain-containing protein [Phycisphaerae bacterium]|nr:VWA domain-containing protein [Phycisphaerae bacterium]
MNPKCQFCTTGNPAGARFCQGCGRPLASTSVGGRTAVLSPPGVPGMPAVETKTIVQMARQAFGGTAVRLGTGALPQGRAGQREHLAIVKDVSGSMADQFDTGVTKLQAAIRASINLVLGKAQTDPQDQIGLVTFNSRAEVLEELHPVGTHKSQIIYILQSLTPDDGTDINEGLEAARDLFDWSRSDVVRRIVLLTDGQGGEPLRTAEDLKVRGVVIDVIGIGDSPANVNEKLLRKVASVVGGQLRYRFIKDHQTLVAHYTQLANKTATI